MSLFYSMSLQSLVNWRVLFNFGISKPFFFISAHLEMMSPTHTSFFIAVFFLSLYRQIKSAKTIWRTKKKRAIGIHWSCFFYTNILIVLINWSDSFFLCTLINSNLIEFLFISLYCSLANEWKPDNEPWKNLASEFYWTMKKKTWWTMNNIFWRDCESVAWFWLHT